SNDALVDATGGRAVDLVRRDTTDRNALRLGFTRDRRNALVGARRSANAHDASGAQRFDYRVDAEYAYAHWSLVLVPGAWSVPAPSSGVDPSRVLGFQPRAQRWRLEPEPIQGARP